MAVMDADASQTPFIKDLASSDRRLRTESLAAIHTFLASRTCLTTRDAQRLWTGLFWALWMTDRPRPQARLADELAYLVFALPAPRRRQQDISATASFHSKAQDTATASSQEDHSKVQDTAPPFHQDHSKSQETAPPFHSQAQNSQPFQDHPKAHNSPAPPEEDPSIPWLRAAWSVLSTNWIRIDALRLNKFMLLARRLFTAHLRLAVQRRDAAILAVLRDYVLDVADETHVALGLRLHVLDIWVDELARVGLVPELDQDKQSVTSGGSDQLDQGAQGITSHGSGNDLVLALGDMVEQLTSSPVKSVRARAKESRQDARLPWVQAANAQEGHEDDDAMYEDWDGIDD